ncbi:hypothetical protein, partial [Heyndrickxia sporothermodurans]
MNKITYIKPDRIDKFFYYGNQEKSEILNVVDYYNSLNGYLKSKFLVDMVLEKIPDTKITVDLFKIIDNQKNVKQIDSQEIYIFLKKSIEKNLHIFSQLVNKQLDFICCVSTHLSAPPIGQIMDYRENENNIDIIMIIGHSNRIGKEKEFNEEWLTRGILYTLYKRLYTYYDVETECKKYDIYFTLELYNSILWAFVLCIHFPHNFEKYSQQSKLNELKIFHKIILNNKLNIKIYN